MQREHIASSEPQYNVCETDGKAMASEMSRATAPSAGEERRGEEI